MAKKTARMPWRTKEAIMRWHSYQSLVVRARRKRVGSTGILPVGVLASRLNTSLQILGRLEARRPHRQDACATNAESFDYDYEQEHE